MDHRQTTAYTDDLRNSVRSVGTKTNKKSHRMEHPKASPRLGTMILKSGIEHTLKRMATESRNAKDRQGALRLLDAMRKSKKDPAGSKTSRGSTRSVSSSLSRQSFYGVPARDNEEILASTTYKRDYPRKLPNSIYAVRPRSTKNAFIIPQRTPTTQPIVTQSKFDEDFESRNPLRTTTYMNCYRSPSNMSRPMQIRTATSSGTRANNPQTKMNFLITPQMTLQAISGCEKRPNSVAAKTEFTRECQSQSLSNPHRKPEVDLVDEMVHFTSGSTELSREQLLTMHQNCFITVYQRDFQMPKQSFPGCCSELQILPQSAEDTQIRDDENDTHTDSKVIGWRRNTSPCENPARLEQQIGSVQTRVPQTRYGSSGPYKRIAVGVLPEGLNRIYLNMTGRTTYQDEISFKEVLAQMATSDHRPFVGIRG
ncbi:hypothetical protein D915_000959 [Fasciola hepatica]|uniref:Uncharacterized protein n=1 Tax=Fasciola hepatica TaxID=6192 RepID=A0A4E0RZM7_FASHE|nr:hypothetical protein D915_000959 [Fasciola hepatica]